MVARVQKISEGYAIVLTEDALRELNLSEGSAVEIRPVEEAAPAFEYASVEEVLKAHREMEPEYAPAYRELAK
jgi:antitoxin component of MazEF toxin-antitoxin module